MLSLEAVMQFSIEGFRVHTSVIVLLKFLQRPCSFGLLSELIAKLLQLVRHVSLCLCLCLMTEKHWPWVCHEVFDALQGLSVLCGDAFLGVGAVFFTRSIQKFG
jgi:hypothetical protein